MPSEPQPSPALQAPWRYEYLEKMGEHEKSSGPPGSGSGSFLRDAFLDPSRDTLNHVIHRDANGLIMLNRFPYAGGHVLVALGESRPRLLDYDATQRASFWALVDMAMELVEKALEPQGVNVGINQGRAAGAGVPQHLHAHLVPRWGGDVNFMNVVGNIRIIPVSLEVMATRYRAALSRLARSPGGV